MIVACVKWRFCWARRTSGEAAGHEIRAGRERERAATNPGRGFLFLFFCARISWPAASLVLVRRARQNRHATQAKRKTTKLFSTSYIRSFVVYLQVPFTKLKVCLLDLWAVPSQVLTSGLAYTPQISLLYFRIGEIIVSNNLQARAAFSLLRFVCRLKLKKAWRAFSLTCSWGHSSSY